MTSLVDKLAKEPNRTTVINDCVDLIDNQVKQKGFVIKSAYATIKALKKKFVPEVVDSMLDEWLNKLQPHYDKWAVAKASSFSDYLVARGDDVAEDLLAVTDGRAERSSHGTAKKMYGRMRDGAKKNVIEAIPSLAQLIERHIKAQEAKSA